MRNSVAQKHLRGCGVACLAFVLEIPYTKAIKLLKEKGKTYHGSYCRDLVNILNQNSKPYSYHYINEKIKDKINTELAIVYTRKTKEFPAGHFLVRYNYLWMDSWINYKNTTSKVKEAKSGFRKNLPADPIYILLPKD